MPAVPSSLIELLWAELEALLGSRPEFSPTHPWGCHRRGIPDRVVFEHIVAALVHGSGYEVIASRGCSDRTIRRRVTAWAQRGLGTQAPPDHPGRLPVDRRKGGLKRSVCAEADGVPVGIVSAGANRHDSPLLESTIHATKQQVGALPNNPVMHPDSGYDSKPSRAVLAEHDLIGEIAKKGIPSPIQVGKRWVVERTHSWMNNFGKLRRCTDRDGVIVDFYLYLAAAFVTLRCLIQKARHTHRWEGRPTTHRLK